MLTDDILRAIVAIARDGVFAATAAGVPAIEPLPGDLVVRADGFHDSDPDAIGWLVAHGNAPYYANGDGPIRDSWDVKALSGRVHGGMLWLRWQDATFARVPSRVHALVEALLRSP